RPDPGPRPGDRPVQARLRRALLDRRGGPELVGGVPQVPEASHGARHRDRHQGRGARRPLSRHRRGGGGGGRTGEAPSETLRPDPGARPGLRLAMSRRPRSEEARLWALVAATVRPLPGRTVEIPADEPARPPKPSAPPKAPAPFVPAAHQVRPRVTPSPPPLSQPGDIEPGRK